MHTWWCTCSDYDSDFPVGHILSFAHKYYTVVNTIVDTVVSYSQWF